MRLVCVAVVVALVCATLVEGDVYMHNPRGSNNRLNEQSANRNNGNRLFDSQNNNKGGYNVGDSTDQAADSQDEQFAFTYYQGSVLYITWTNQHGCGGGDDENENRQVRCELVVQAMCDEGLRNGINTGTPNEQDSDTSTGRHETAEYYDACKNTIERNKGLFTADQNLQGDNAIYTRQNPNGGRSGLECPEERDYFPWWHPNPWKTLVVMGFNSSKFEWYKEVVEATQPGLDLETLEAPWSRDNHLGNGRTGYQNSVNYTMPSPQALCGENECKCVLRLRYNISTSDYPWDQDASLNGDVLSPVQQNPVVDIGVRQGLKLAINTAQTGRTFQDRSHIFHVKQRPSGVSGGTIHNLNVQGKRGNIVQTYPSVEYDFVPNCLHIKGGDWVHFQWEGSNTHNNGPNGGDGQTGDDGEGTGGTDRSNVVQCRDRTVNYPLHRDAAFMWESVTGSSPRRSSEELMLEMATAGKGADTDNLLNNSPASHDAGLMRFKRGEYNFMCTRNNNFSNRSQKGTIIVK